jgi:hypothetical protein
MVAQPSRLRVWRRPGATVRRCGGGTPLELAAETATLLGELWLYGVNYG